MAVEQLDWKTETYKLKATELCICIFNLYIHDGGDFYKYRSLSIEYFEKIIKTKNYVYPIINNLVNNSK
jgi:hypothetical protein